MFRKIFKYNKIIAALLLVMLCVGCSNDNVQTVADSSQSVLSLEDDADNDISESVNAVSENLIDGINEEAAIKETEEPEIEPFEEYDIHICAFGDNLMHIPVISSGKQSDGSYDFSFLYENIKPFLDKSDIKIINQETILGGNKKGFSGFPAFNSPVEVADAIRDAGFNVVLHASNHVDDMGIDSINYCKKYWDENCPEVTVVGIYGEEGKDGRIPTVSVNDITFAVLNYTYGANYAALQPDLEKHVNLFTLYDPNTRMLDLGSLNPEVLEEIKRAKEIADVVIVCPHWGVEYQTKQSWHQEMVANAMIDAGADVIIGAHPHVVQPVEWIETENGNTGLCYYSLGNYVSSQYDAISLLEGMAWVTFHVTEDGVNIVKEDTGVVPMVLHYTSGPLKIQGVYTLDEYTEEMALEHGAKSRSGIVLHKSYLEEKSQEIFGDMVISIDP